MAQIRVGIGGWTFEPWRGTFYPKGLPHARELEFASRAMTAIEINGTYYSTFKPASWRNWRDATPEDFVFTVKASRYITNRRVLAEAGPAIDKFISQGLSELGPKLGPINWQFMPAKKFDAQDFGAFLDLIPKKLGKLPLRHALEVRNPSFATPEFYKLAQKHKAAVVLDLGKDYPEIDVESGGFSYIRAMTTSEKSAAGIAPSEVKALAKRAKTLARKGDVFLYFISGAKEKNPAAAAALIAELGG